jgi:ElaB/YqjD/DUF883 family membrane-anchored ribosome-binding protein
MKTNGHRSPDEIQADIERTRANLDETLTAIEYKLNPSQLFDQGVDYLRHSGAREYVSNLGESAKQEPIPLALVGIGLAWLMLSNGRSTTSTTHLTSEDLATRTKSAAGTVSDSVRGTMASMRDSASRTSDRISDATHRIGQTASAARERASQMSASARHQAERMRHGYERVVNEHPLALGAVGLAVGAILAATAPRTRHEDRLMGEASRRAKDNVREAGKEQFERAASSLETHTERHERDEHTKASTTTPTGSVSPATGAGTARSPSSGVSSPPPPDRSMH